MDTSPRTLPILLTFEEGCDSLRIGRAVRFRPSDLEEFAQRHRSR